MIDNNIDFKELIKLDWKYHPLRIGRNEKDTKIREIDNVDRKLSREIFFRF